jgi:hypothetical protein
MFRSSLGPSSWSSFRAWLKPFTCFNITVNKGASVGFNENYRKKVVVFKIILLYGQRKYAVVENKHFTEKYIVKKYKLYSRIGAIFP